MQNNPTLYGFGLEFSSGEKKYYTGKSGKDYLSFDSKDSFIGYNRVGVLRKALRLIERQGIENVKNVILVKN